VKCGLIRKIVTWEGIHASTMRYQTVSNNVCLSGHTDTVPVNELAVGDSLWRTNRPTINLHRKKLVRLIVRLSLLFF